MDEVAIGDVVELTEPVDLAPAGAHGGIADVLDDRVIVEVMTLPLEPIVDRIVFVPPETLRIVKRAQPQA